MGTALSSHTAPAFHTELSASWAQRQPRSRKASGMAWGLAGWRIKPLGTARRGLGQDRAPAGPSWSNFGSFPVPSPRQQRCHSQDRNTGME